MDNLLKLSDIDGLIGLPWSRGAMGTDSFDCWGLVKYCLELKGIDVNHAVDYTFKEGISSEFELGYECMEEIPSMENNCIIYGYNRDGLPTHIGMVIDGYVFHAVGEEGKEGSVMLTKLRAFKKLYKEVRFFKWLH